MKNVLFFLLLSGFTTLPVQGQQLEFVRENVIFLLDMDHLRVTAELWFRNPGPQTVTQTVHIPFACDGSDYKTDSLFVMDCTNNISLKPFRQNIAGTLVQVTVAAKEQTKLKVLYIQNHDRKRAGYILTKVKYWNKPLTEANYTLIVESPSIQIDSCSFKPDAVSTDGKQTRQTWQKSNFKPSKELCFYFHLE